ncbi:ComF family protein [Romboutsia maritimum]|uniref:ComF family protein n=1 Tax=Romboutsia maritimum TaxID=2020948 RepID=A0A371IQR5_9FIRM|nr:ComF family protein [Romboutsia maritimum]RDY22829.1 ComF family protein [Romboutsia maritimum]
MKKYINSLYKTFNNIFETFLDFIYPENITCIICNKPVKKNNTYSMCKNCFDELHFILDGCRKCGKPIINHSLEKQDIEGCSYCFNKNFYFDKAISCIEYNDMSKKMVLSLKYNNKTYMSKYIASIMKDKLEIENINFDYILFVPLHKIRLRRRGFNQSEKIAVYLGKITKKPVINIIDRKKYTKKLYKLNKKEREKELKEAFSLKDNGSIKNKNVIVVDDIFTTGTTVNEISKLLKNHGVSQVFIITLLTKNIDTYVKA